MPIKSAVVDDAGGAVWRENGRPLTEWERSLRAKRTDIWLPIGAAVYRLALGYRQLCELENAIGSGIGRLWGGLSGPEGGAPAPAAHYLDALRLALIGGGIGVRNGESFPVSPVLAASIVEATSAGPLEMVMASVRALLAALAHGRDATPEEVATFSIPAGHPVIPAWASEYRA